MLNSKISYFSATTTNPLVKSRLRRGRSRRFAGGERRRQMGKGWGMLRKLQRGGGDWGKGFVVVSAFVYVQKLNSFECCSANACFIYNIANFHILILSFWFFICVFRCQKFTTLRAWSSSVASIDSGSAAWVRLFECWRNAWWWLLFDNCVTIRSFSSLSLLDVVTLYLLEISVGKGRSLDVWK